MQNIRTIGGAGGVFHILVPGMFLLLNIIGSLYVFPLTPTETREEIQTVLGNPTMGMIITIGFGYLFGIILRIFRSEYPDKLSARFLQFYDRNARPPETEKNCYAYDKFPYTKWLEQAICHLPSDVQGFFNQHWEKADHKTYFNFSKLVVISKDERAANEIYAAESLCRYISGMFYALVASAVLIVLVLFAQTIMLQMPNIVFIILLLGYMISIFGILVNYRFMRIKEVQTVFYSTYTNRDLFE